MVPMVVTLSNPRAKKTAVFELSGVLVDTGADKSGIPEDAVAQIEKVVGKFKKTTRLVLTGAGLTRLTVLEDVFLCIGPAGVQMSAGKMKKGDLVKGGCCTRTSLLAVPKLQASMLLGRDLLMPCRAVIDFGKKQFCFEGGGCMKMEGL